MKAAAFLNLPMQARRARVVNLHAVHAKVVLLRFRVFSVNQRQRKERAAVFLPGRQHRQSIEMRLEIDYLGHWPTRDSARAEP
jgi:hypothetical protein